LADESTTAAHANEKVPRLDRCGTFCLPFWGCGVISR